MGLWEWWQRLKQRADERKVRGDRYIDAAIRSMEVPVEMELGDRQNQIRTQQKVLEQLLVEAANALAQDQISQESFRTFNDAYETARAVLQRCVENISEDLCEQYIQQLIGLQQASESELYTLLQTVETSLIKKEMTQTSFRTFMDAYKAATAKNEKSM
ncbi:MULTISPECIES: hypothetical protein [unclassified Leptolyngbya]|uniref:hypothetical protein n=1 Tax=unclassified Leptolyngbya TaxID=2650499 RepID=UPI0016863085|nr:MULTISPECIES: hypothetical protein [unclassified Leptolyngbya]MBD1910047.1 hypothetical protein [Leptolyngbya sp. FACHB-8]MBD2153064.1 hypothetical protein [Leptolyngbya sp. FACHB-16]